MSVRLPSFTPVRLDLDEIKGGRRGGRVRKREKELIHYYAVHKAGGPGLLV